MFAEGGIHGGGGKGIQCTGKDGKPTLELLDLWEGRVLGSGLSDKNIPQETNEPYEVIVARGIEVLKNAFVYHGKVGHYDPATNKFVNIEGAEALKSQLSSRAELFTNPQMVNVQRRRNVELTLTPDSYEDGLPKGCEIKQIVIYKDDGRILMDQDLFDALDNVNKAALVLHEIFYAELREYGETNSLRTRRAVSHVLAGKTFTPVTDRFSKPYMKCSTINDGRVTSVVYYAKVQIGPNSTMIGSFYDRIAGIPMIAHGGGGAGRPVDWKEFLAEFKRKDTSGYSGGMTNYLWTNVDVDTQVTLAELGQNKVRVDLKKLAGIPTNRSETLGCKFVK